MPRKILITMKIKEQYKVREMAGEHVIIMQGKHGSDLTKIISLNESALYLWNELQGKEFDAEVVANLIMHRGTAIRITGTISFLSQKQGIAEYAKPLSQIN